MNARYMRLQSVSLHLLKKGLRSLVRLRGIQITFNHFGEGHELARTHRSPYIRRMIPLGVYFDLAIGAVA